ncbi:hypothetical protein [Tenacibaculum agarivorans]|uniref:hypothetical protein n=1 Tax=Tenacibaculum agarivorans TaxID=1908389 RepID=UPI000AF6C27A|nr:hypothetical protein [Tenacibaculum agarivorans]
MKKVFFKIAIFLVLVTMTSCNEEKVVIETTKEAIEQIEYKKSELPDTAVNAEQLLSKQGILVKKNLVGTNLTRSNSANYRKYFVLYPYEWTFVDRLNFLNKVKKRSDVFVEFDLCTYVDTWYIQQTTIFPPSLDRTRNLIKASDSEDIELEEDNDGPGLPKFLYSNCNEVPLPQRAPIITLGDPTNDGEDTGDDTTNEDVNTPKK